MIPLGLVLFGCATAPAGPQVVPPEYDQIRDFIAKAAAAYGMDTPHIVPTEWEDRAAIVYKDQQLYVSRRTLICSQAILEPLLAHELGHHVLGHRGSSLGPFEEAAANAEAVRILTKLNGGHEDRAFDQVYFWLLRLHRQGYHAKGHFDACTEIKMTSARQTSLQEAVRKAAHAPVSAGTDRVSVAWTELSRAADLDPNTVWVATQNTWRQNAASLGAHHFIVTRAVVDQANTCVLWGLIAHELAHDVLRHADRATTTVDVLSMVGTAVGAVVPGGNLAVAGAGTLGLRAYSPSQEAEADQRAIAILRAAGKPEWVLRYTLEHLRRISRAESGGWLATHPGLDERIASQPAFDAEAAYQVCSPPVNQCRYDLATGRCVDDENQRR